MSFWQNVAGDQVFRVIIDQINQIQMSVSLFS